MLRPGLALLAVIAQGACIIVTKPNAPAPPDEDRLPRFQGGVQARGGVATVADDEPGGADGSAAAAGFQAFGALRLAPPLTAGLAFDFTASRHDSTSEDYRGVSYLHGTWALLLRGELPRVTIAGWGSWYFGRRNLSRPTAVSSGASTSLQGPGLGGAVLYRFSFPGHFAVELGPYLQMAWLETDDEVAPVVEAGRSIRPLSAGLALQLVYGARP